MNETETLATYAAARLGYNPNARLSASSFGVDEIGEGWSILGRGCSRTAYLGPDGFVYKVASAGNEYIQGNEIRRSVRVREALADIPGWGLPVMELVKTEYGPVIVAEYIEGIDPGPVFGNDDDLWDLYHAVSRLVEFYDSGTFNTVLADDGTIYIVDLG
jgi:hypothetical protein